MQFKSHPRIPTSPFSASSIPLQLQELLHFFQNYEQKWKRLIEEWRRTACMIHYILATTVWCMLAAIVWVTLRFVVEAPHKISTLSLCLFLVGPFLLGVILCGGHPWLKQLRVQLEKRMFSWLLWCCQTHDLWRFHRKFRQDATRRLEQEAFLLGGCQEYWISLLEPSPSSLQQDQLSILTREVQTWIAGQIQLQQQKSQILMMLRDFLIQDMSQMVWSFLSLG